MTTSPWNLWRGILVLGRASCLPCFLGACYSDVEPTNHRQFRIRNKDQQEYRENLGPHLPTPWKAEHNAPARLTSCTAQFENQLLAWILWAILADLPRWGLPAIFPLLRSASSLINTQTLEFKHACSLKAVQTAPNQPIRASNLTPPGDTPMHFFPLRELS